MSNISSTTAGEKTTSTPVLANEDDDLTYDNDDGQDEEDVEEGRLHYTIIFTTLHYKSILN